MWIKKTTTTTSNRTQKEKVFKKKFSIIFHDDFSSVVSTYTRQLVLHTVEFKAGENKNSNSHKLHNGIKWLFKFQYKRTQKKRHETHTQTCRENYVCEYQRNKNDVKVYVLAAMCRKRKLMRTRLSWISFFCDYSTFQLLLLWFSRQRNINANITVRNRCWIAILLF